MDFAKIQAAIDVIVTMLTAFFTELKAFVGGFKSSYAFEATEEEAAL